MKNKEKLIREKRIKNLGNYAIKGKSPATGIPRTKDVKEKVSIANKGKHASEKTEFKKGKEHPMFGKKLPKCWKDNISKGNIGKKKSFRTKEHTIRMKESLKKGYKSGKLKPNKGTFKKGDKRFVEMRKNGSFVIPKIDSSIELKIQNFLKKLKIKFETHKYMQIKYGYQCDIYIPKQKNIKEEIIIEADGDYWHGNPEKNGNFMKYPLHIRQTRCRDFERTAQLEEKGYRVIRLWEHEIKPLELNEFKKILK